MVHVISHAIQVDNLFHRAGLGVNLLNSSLSFTTLCRAWIELIMHGMLILFWFSAWQSQLLLVVTVLLHCQFSSTRWIFLSARVQHAFLDLSWNLRSYVLHIFRGSIVFYVGQGI